METLLLTGFGPFGAHARNISEEAAEQLDGLELDGFRVKALRLPVHLGQAVRLLEEALEEGPAAVVACGIYDPTADEPWSIRVEVAASNEQDYPIPDRMGERVRGPVIADGPAAAYATLPVGAIKHALDGAGIATQLSEDSGRYLCNAIFYWLTQHHDRVGFLHVPSDETRIDDVVTALRISLQATAARLSAEQVDAAAG